MTKKHYIMIAKAIKNNTIVNLRKDDEIVIRKESLINDLINDFQSDNALFDWRKFDDACNK